MRSRRTAPPVGRSCSPPPRPYDLVKPFADRLGLDDVVATRYGVSPDGTYDGTLDGPFVWSAGKLAAITEWADRNGVDLAESYAYSDSVYDTPMLAAVGHPVVVNPDPRMVLVAAARRWPTLNLDVSPGVLKVPVIGLEVQELALRFARPGFYPYARFDIDGVDNIPATGPAILCGNHRSYFDVAAMSLDDRQERSRRRASSARRRCSTHRSSGRSQPRWGASESIVGRAPTSRWPPPADALAGGEMVTMMPEGTIPRGPAFFRKPVGRWGAARLAQLSGAPIIPVGLWGTEQVWPRSSRLPNVLNLSSPPTVRVRVGEPVELKGRSLEADTKRLMACNRGVASRRCLPSTYVRVPTNWR